MISGGLVLSGTSVQFWMGVQDEYALRETLPSIQAKLDSDICLLPDPFSEA